MFCSCGINRQMSTDEIKKHSQVLFQHSSWPQSLNSESSFGKVFCNPAVVHERATSKNDQYVTGVNKHLISTKNYRTWQWTLINFDIQHQSKAAVSWEWKCVSMYSVYITWYGHQNTNAPAHKCVENCSKHQSSITYYFKIYDGSYHPQWDKFQDIQLSTHFRSTPIFNIFCTVMNSSVFFFSQKFHFSSYVISYFNKWGSNYSAIPISTDFYFFKISYPAIS